MRHHPHALGASSGSRHLPTSEGLARKAVTPPPEQSEMQQAVGAVDEAYPGVTLATALVERHR